VFPWLRELLGRFSEEETGTDRLGMIESVLDLLQQLEEFGFEERMERIRGDAIPAHSDFQSDNLLFEGSELIGIVDFDNIRPQPSVVDIAWTVSLTCYEGNDFDASSMTDLLEGYTSARRFPDDERRLLLPVVVLHHGVRFALAYQQVIEGEEDESKLRTEFERATDAWAFFGH
jgi:Ser/Thr protein kinase RdoA (MazF antagonist)